MTIILIVLYEAIPRHCCGSEYESNYTFPYLIWACNHLTNQSALTSLKNTKGKIHPLVLGGICNQRLRCKEPGASPSSLLCPLCCRHFQLDTDHTNAAHQLKASTPFSHLAFEKVQKPAWDGRWTGVKLDAQASCQVLVLSALRDVAHAGDEPVRWWIPSHCTGVAQE